MLTRKLCSEFSLLHRHLLSKDISWKSRAWELFFFVFGKFNQCNLKPFARRLTNWSKSAADFRQEKQKVSMVAYLLDETSTTILIHTQSTRGLFCVFLVLEGFNTSALCRENSQLKIICSFVSFPNKWLKHTSWYVTEWHTRADLLLYKKIL